MKNEQNCLFVCEQCLSVTYLLDSAADFPYVTSHNIIHNSDRLDIMVLFVDSPAFLMLINLYITGGTFLYSQRIIHFSKIPFELRIYLISFLIMLIERKKLEPN